MAKGKRKFLLLGERILMANERNDGVQKRHLKRKFRLTERLYNKYLSEECELMPLLEQGRPFKFVGKYKEDFTLEHDLDLRDWIVEQMGMSAPINDDLVMERANELVGTDKKFKASKIWLDAFKKRTKIEYVQFEVGLPAEEEAENEADVSIDESDEPELSEDQVNLFVEVIEKLLKFDVVQEYYSLQSRIDRAHGNDENVPPRNVTISDVTHAFEVLKSYAGQINAKDALNDITKLEKKLEG